MFLLINKYLVDQEDLEVVHPAHGAWLADQCRSGPVVMAGRQVPSVGGVVMIDVATRAEAEAFAASDPYTGAGVARYTVIEFNLARCFPDRLPEVTGS
jgi:uncharacterized protein YciI